jgi:hypothetical protein
VPTFLFFNLIIGRTLIILDTDFSPSVPLCLPRIFETFINNCATNSFASLILRGKIPNFLLLTALKYAIGNSFFRWDCGNSACLGKIQSITPNTKILGSSGSTQCFAIDSISADGMLGKIHLLQEDGSAIWILTPPDGIKIKIMSLQNGIVSIIDSQNTLPLRNTGETIVTGMNIPGFSDQPSD